MERKSGGETKTLWEKLGLREALSLLVVHRSAYAKANYLDHLPFPVDRRSKYETGLAFIHIFADRMDVLAYEIPRALQALKPDGMLWVSWPKKASRKPTDLTEDRIRDLILPLGLVDVKVCSVTEDLWSGLKLVWRKELR